MSVQERLENLRDLIRVRIIDKKRAYVGTFGRKDNVAAQAVLADLAQFCRASASTFAANEREHCLREGRREVWLRIRQHLNMSDDEVDRLVDRAISERKL